MRIRLYPLEEDTKANPTPVFPLVGSIIVAPGFKTPRVSASSIIAKAIRSFTLPAGLKYSSLPTTLARKFLLALKLENSNNGVFPTNSVKLLAILAISFSI